MLSIFFATRTMPVMSMIHGTIATPVGELDMADSSIFTNITFSTMSVHIDANILSQPRKISAVLFEPPIANASGAQ